MKSLTLKHARSALLIALKAIRRHVYKDDKNVMQLVCGECGAMGNTHSDITHDTDCPIIKIHQAIESIEDYQKLAEYISSKTGKQILKRVSQPIHYDAAIEQLQDQMETLERLKNDDVLDWIEEAARE